MASRGARVRLIGTIGVLAAASVAAVGLAVLPEQGPGRESMPGVVIGATEPAGDPAAGDPAATGPASGSGHQATVPLPGVDPGAPPHAAPEGDLGALQGEPSPEPTTAPAPRPSSAPERPASAAPAPSEPTRDPAPRPAEPSARPAPPAGVCEWDDDGWECDDDGDDDGDDDDADDDSDDSDDD